MSAEQLSKLTLGDTMVTTRAGAARARTGPPQSAQNSPQSSPISPTPSLIESTAGHLYDVSAFDDELRTRAKRGLKDNSIGMQFCNEDEDGSRYFFHLEDDITVDMEGDRRPKCSCGANQDNKACRHIFWILGQLTSTLPKDQAIELAEDGSSVRNNHPAEIIQRFTLERIAKNLKWTFEDDPLPEEDELVDEIANMLSVFEPAEALPIEFKNEDTRELSEQSRKYREFQGIILEHAQKYPAFFLQLQEKLSPDFQVRVFFDKINNRVDKAFRALDEYIEKGPTNTRSEALDVVNCATRLRALVRAVDDYCEESLVADAGDGRDDLQVEGLAVTSLVRILEKVTTRNYNAYAASTWGMPSTDPKENNLFVCLIGHPSEHQGLFVLDTLVPLTGHEDVVRDHVVDLVDIEGRLRAIPSTPPAYLDSFRALITDKRKRAASQSGGSSAKRAMQ